MAVLDMVDKLTTALDENEFAMGVFLELSKAIYTLNQATTVYEDPDME